MVTAPARAYDRPPHGATRPRDATDTVTARMRADWNQRAVTDARRAINDREYEGFDFALSGCRDAFEILGPLHERLRHVGRAAQAAVTVRRAATCRAAPSACRRSPAASRCRARAGRSRSRRPASSC